MTSTNKIKLGAGVVTLTLTAALTVPALAANVPTDRSEASTPAEHFADHNELARLHNVLDTKVGQDIRRHGARVVGDGATDVSEAVSAAVSAAGAGGVVIFPEGTWRIPISGRTALNDPPDNQLWMGMGPGTVLKADGPSPDAPLVANGTLAFVGPGKRLRLANMEVRGPAGAGAFTANGIYHAGGADTGQVICDRVRFSGRWPGGAIKTAPAGAGNGNVSRTYVGVHGCEFDLDDGIGIAHNGERGARLLVDQSVFKRFGRAGSNQYHAVYPRNAVSARITNTDFIDQLGTGWAIHAFGGPGSPEYWDVENVYLGPALHEGVITPAGFTAKLRGITAEAMGAEAVTAQGNVDVHDSQFRTAAWAAHPIVTFSAPVTIRVFDSTFERNAAVINLAHNGSTAQLHQCRLPNLAGAASPFALTATDVNTLRSHIRDCEFSDTAGPGAGPATARPAANRAGVGAQYFNTSTGVVNFSDGSGWRNPSGARLP
ncbi:MAG TPA: hypothetical protein VHE80_10575 [Acidimicrobiales bacterium]|nr:hypothetical protein [Acidimicrobiales bacterium]